MLKSIKKLLGTILNQGRLMKFINGYFLVVPLLITLSFVSVQATTRDQARKLYSSLTGTTPTSTEITLIAGKLDAGKAREAARDIVDSKNGINSQGTFYNITVKNFATPWSNVEYTKMFPLNDLSATVIGWTRDEKPFNQILFSDSMYVASGINMAGGSSTTNTTHLTHSSTASCSDITGVVACSFCSVPTSPIGRIIFFDPLVANSNVKLCRLTSVTSTVFNAAVGSNGFYIPHLDVILTTGLIKSTNAMYENIESLNLNLSDKRLLVEKSQAPHLHQKPEAISGIMSSRAWGAANFSAGTNRRSFQSSMLHLFCKKMEDVSDTNTPDFRVRRDIDRSPGGASTTFKALCVGCHSVMDPHVGAYAYYNFTNGAISYTPGQVVTKMNHNAIFPEGYITQDDSWINLSNEGQNASFEWGAVEAGAGLKSLGQMYSETKEFNRCMAQTVFKTVCFKDATSSEEKALVKTLSLNFEEDNFNMKNLFINTSISCMGK